MNINGGVGKRANSERNSAIASGGSHLTTMSERSKREIKPKVDKLSEYKRAREGGKRILKVFPVYCRFLTS